MAIETRYIVENNDRKVPSIYRTISVDGAEVSRGEPSFEEVAAADPTVIALYFNTVSSFLSEKSALLDSNTEFTAETYLAVDKIRAWAFDFMTRFDQKVLMAAPGYPYFDDFEEPGPAEETLEDE